MAGLLRATSRILKVRREALRIGSSRRRRLDLGEEGSLWSFIGRAPRHTRLLQPDLRSMIETFWEEHSRASPEYKKVLRRRVQRGEYVEHHACFLEMTQTELYLEFRHAHPAITISQRSFEACKPWFVRYSQQRDTCCCRYHVGFQLLYSVFRGFIGHSGSIHPTSPRDFVHSLLCARREDNDMYHRMACVQGTCDVCGSLRLLQISELDSSDQEMVRWRQYEYVMLGDSRRLQLVEHLSPRIDFITRFRTAIYPYIQHAHGAKWQDRQFRASIAQFPIGTVVSVVDFAKNYTFAPQQEIQSEYYFSE